MRQPIIAPSILSADFSDMTRELAAINNADWVHVDIMDNHFVPNLTFGAGFTAAIAKICPLPLDVHLMIDDPERWVADYVKAGAYTVVFHCEATRDPYALAEQIRGLNARAGMSVKPGTPITPYLDRLECFDEILIMSVEPGFGGQAFMPKVLDKVRELRRVIDERGLSTDINIDGGISEKTIAQAAEAGCDAFVAGSAVYGAASPARQIETLRTLAAQARRGD